MFRYLIKIEPLGLLYGSSGKFLSPENLVGRSGTSFPPSTATLSGLYAATLDQKDPKDYKTLGDLQLAGPFWGDKTAPQSFYVPLPKIYYRPEGQERPSCLKWKSNGEAAGWQQLFSGKFPKDLWIPITEWQDPQTVRRPPWEFLRHLHPRLKEDERHVDVDSGRGSLFLENSVQMDPDSCLIYLSNTPIADGWYRFGGEGHMVDLECHPLDEKIQERLSQPVERSFALITPAVWGSNRLSYREPQTQTDTGSQNVWECEAMITDRPSTFRFRMGGKGSTKRLGRGRYSVPAGTVYILKHPLPEGSWENWPESWFPKEAYSFKRWGCGLSLPLPQVLSQSN